MAPGASWKVPRLAPGQVRKLNSFQAKLRGGASSQLAPEQARAARWGRVRGHGTLRRVHTNYLASFIGIALIVVILRDAFETLVLPQTVNRRVRPARIYYIVTWYLWTRFTSLARGEKRRQAALTIFGPLSLLGLFSVWALTLILAFALLQWGFGSHLDLVRGVAGFGADLYMSGTTFFTLGLGDVTPNSRERVS